jgi:hypothetical protein
MRQFRSGCRDMLVYHGFSMFETVQIAMLAAAPFILGRG